MSQRITQTLQEAPRPLPSSFTPEKLIAFLAEYRSWYGFQRENALRAEAGISPRTQEEWDEIQNQDHWRV